MGVEQQIRPDFSDAVDARLARAALLAEEGANLWDCVYHAGLEQLGIHAPERRDSPEGETVGADDDGAPDTLAAEASP